MNKVIGGEFAITKTLLQKRDNICQIPFGAGRSAFYYILEEIKEFGGTFWFPISYVNP